MATDEVNYTAKDDRENSGSITSETNPIWNDRYSGDVSLSAAKYDVLNKILEIGIYNSTRVARKHSEAQTRDVNYDDRILVLKQGLDLPGRNELEQEEYIYMP